MPYIRGMTWLELERKLTASGIAKIAGTKTARSMCREARAQGDLWEAYSLIRADKYGGRRQAGLFFWLPISRRFVVHFASPPSSEISWDDAHPNAMTALEVMRAGRAGHHSARPVAPPATGERPYGFGGKGVLVVSGKAPYGFSCAVVRWPYVEGPKNEELWNRLVKSSAFRIAKTRSFRAIERAHSAGRTLAEKLRVTIIGSQLPGRPRTIE